MFFVLSRKSENSYQGRVTNPETDSRIKYNLDANKVVSAMREAGVDQDTELHSGSEYSPAKDITKKLGMDGDNRNVRRGVERFIEHESITPKK